MKILEQRIEALEKQTQDLYEKIDYEVMYEEIIGRYANRFAESIIPVLDDGILRETLQQCCQ